MHISEPTRNAKDTLSDADHTGTSEANYHGFSCDLFKIYQLTTKPVLTETDRELDQ